MELVVVIAIMGVLAALTAPSIGRWMRNQRLKDFARSAGDLLLLARAEATRTGDRHVVFFGPAGTTDPAGTDIEDVSGQTVPMLALDDGAPAASDCRIGGGEARRVVRFEDDVRWGVALATARAPGDNGDAPFSPPQSSGGTFADPDGNPVPWLLFRPDGVPVDFTGATDCGTTGQTGTGGAALYMTNGDRDYAVVLTPIGGVRVLIWDEATGQWQT